ncbi:MAG: hypothetical protein Q8P37_01880 [Candidatus Spechtbacteria bacterium]|nr:hypothetical protein [Candidatus Spechtbacteria bacterium]
MPPQELVVPKVHPAPSQLVCSGYDEQAFGVPPQLALVFHVHPVVPWHDVWSAL